MTNEDAVERVMLTERWARDTGQWAVMAQQYHDDSVVDIRLGSSRLLAETVALWGHEAKLASCRGIATVCAAIYRGSGIQTSDSESAG